MSKKKGGESHPLEKAILLAEKGYLGDPSLSLQTILPSYQRKLLMESLMQYGDTTHSPRTKAELDERKRHIHTLKRAEIALSVSQEEIEASDSNSKVKKTLPYINRLAQTNKLILRQSGKIRHELNGKEKHGSKQYFLGTEPHIST